MMNTWLPLRRRRPRKVNSWRKTSCSPLVQEYNESNKRALLIPASSVTPPTRTEALKGTLRAVPALAVISAAVGFFALRSALSVPSDGRHTEFSLTEKYCCRSAADTAVTGRGSLGRRKAILLVSDGPHPSCSSLTSDRKWHAYLQWVTVTPAKAGVQGNRFSPWVPGFPLSRE
jgi:hypothetical protein